VSEVFAYNPVPVRTVFGYGAVNSLGRELERLSITRPIVICSPGRANLGRQLVDLVKPARAHLCDAGLTAMPEDAFQRVMAEMKSVDSDGIIGVGGGSPIGLLKAAAAHTLLPAIAVVTSYSGSEMSANWYTRKGWEQTGANTSNALPKTVIYDPELTLEFPVTMTAASGMNAINHAVETLYSAETNPIVQDLSEEAIRRLGRSLPRIVEDPSDRGARYDALYGAWHAAMFRARQGLSHAIAQRCRSLFDLVHAESHAISVPYTVAFNQDAAPDAMKRIEHALKVDNAALGLYELNVRLGLATGYKALGVAENDLGEAVKVIMEQTFTNPRPVSEGDLRGILGQAFGGAPPKN